MKILVQNWLAFEKKIDAIAHTVVKNIDSSYVNIFDGDDKAIYPCETINGEYECIFEALDIYELDDVKLYKIQVNDKYYWTSCAKIITFFEDGTCPDCNK